MIGKAKGQSVFLSHTLIILFSVVLLFVVFTTLTNVKEQQKDFMAVKDTAVICNTVFSAVDEIYYSGINMTGKAGKITVDFPVDIAEMDYSGNFYGHQLIISYNNKKYNCTLPFNTSYNGRIKGGETSFMYNSSGVFVS